MEHHSSKRKHHGQHHRSNTNRGSKHDQPIETEKGAHGTSKRPSAHHELPRETFPKPPLSGDNDYVRRWIAQTEKETKVHTNRPRTQEEKTERHDTKQKPKLELRAFRDAFHQAKDAQRQLHPKEKTRNRSSSDSSLLKPCMKTESKSLKGELKSAFERREEAVLHLQKNRKAASLDSASSVDSPVHHEIFEKRDRHKTRDDLYEPKRKKFKVDRQDREEPKKRKKREKKGDKKAAAKKAGEDLMNNFASKTISQDRLTIPPRGPGLFKNGRASSPPRRRGLPDLVFSEMEFLQQPPRYPDLKISKIREKDLQRASREQEEISMFFRPKKTPMIDRSTSARKMRSSTHMSDERSMYINQTAVGGTQDRSQSIDLFEKPFGFRQPQPSSDRFSASRGYTPSSHRMQTVPETISRISENATTAVTWSETLVSPGATAASRTHSHHCLHHASPTPEPIRRSIESTGIFRNTGIERTLKLTSCQAEPSLPPDGLCKETNSKDMQDSQEYSDQATKLARSQSRLTSRHSKPSANDQQSGSRDQTPRQPRNSKFEKATAVESRSRKENENRVIEMKAPATAQRRQAMVDHFTPSIGWHRQQDLDQLQKMSTAIPADANVLMKFKSTPVSREQIAKSAWVKCPATTTLPVETVPEEQNFDDGNNATFGQQEVSAEITENSGDLSTAPVKHVLLPLSVKASSTTTPMESFFNISLGSSQGIRVGNKVQKSGRIDNVLSFQRFSSESLPPQFDQSQDGLPSRGVAIPISRIVSQMPGSSNLDTASKAELPVRRPLHNSFGQTPPHPLGPPLDVEVAPLYLTQIRRQFLPEHPTLENDIGNYRPEDRRGEFSPGRVPYLEENRCYMLGEQDYQDDYAEYHVPEEEEAVGCYPEYDTQEPHPWPLQFDDMMEDYRPWNRLEPAMGNNNYDVLESSYDSQGFAEHYAEHYAVEEQEIDCKNQLTEGVPMLGFWRPNRLL